MTFRAMRVLALLPDQSRRAAYNPGEFVNEHQ